jgi:membrane protease YdiL (CAAX protease family)
MDPINPDEPLLAALRTPAFAQPPQPRNDVLTGPLGLRAGWGILLFVVFASLLGFVLFVGLFKASGRYADFQSASQHAREVNAHAKAAHQPPPAQPPTKVSFALLAETAEASAALLAAFGMGFFEKRNFGVYGLGKRHLRDVLPGALCGLVAISLLIALLRGLHLLVFDTRLLHGAAALRFGAEWLAVFVLVGVFEEFFFRGYIQFTVMRGLLGLGARLSAYHARAAAFWMAAVLWSLVFSMTHLPNAGEDPMGIIMVFVAGILFSYALWRTGSLWWGVGFHMTWDWGQSFLYGVPDSGMLSAGRLFGTHSAGKTILSGGTAGPEGSVYVLPVLVLVALAIRLHPQRKQPPVKPASLPLAMRAATSEAIP